MPKASRVHTPRINASQSSKPPVPPVGTVAAIKSKPIRALTLIDQLSPGCMTFRISDSASSPHLRPGEYAVVDLSDREPQHGELFLVQWRSGERKRSILQATRTWTTISSLGLPEKVWWLCQLAGWRQEGHDGSGIPIFSGLSEGPMKKKGLKKMIVGRIIGYAESDLGNELEQSAGFEE